MELGLYCSVSEVVPLPEQPKGIATRVEIDDIALVITSNQARLVSDGNALVTLPLDYAATSCAFGAKHAAIGSAVGNTC